LANARGGIDEPNHRFLQFLELEIRHKATSDVVCPKRFKYDCFIVKAIPLWRLLEIHRTPQKAAVRDPEQGNRVVMQEIAELGL
jgi:hypothetical protein